MLLQSTVSDGVIEVTFNRPERRNALTPALIRELRSTMAQLDADPAVRAIVLTGADPAFCAGLDLQVLGEPDGGLLGGGDDRDEGASGRDGGGAGGFWEPTSTPVVGAINGPAVTGGLEIALQCDIRIASDRARFADTHARVGVMPGGGLTVRLPQAIGLQRALEMSVTGRFVAATEAAAWGLVSRVVPHERLLAEARAVASAIAELDPDAVATVVGMYRAAANLGFGAEAARAELDTAASWRRRRFDPAAVEARRRAIIERGRSLASQHEMH